LSVLKKTLGIALGCLPLGMRDMPTACRAAVPLAEAAVFHFDAGPVGSKVARDAVLLGVEARYEDGIGYGWRVSPGTSFVRDELARSRDDLTIDGVQGRELVFRADLPPGVWCLTLWVEAGHEDVSSLRVAVQGAARPLGWHAFKPPAEPRRTIQRIYRVYQGPVVVDGEGFQLELSGGQDEVRLLGLSLVRRTAPPTDSRQHLWKALQMDGGYHSQRPLDELARQFDEAVQHDWQDAFCAHWHIRLRLLREAEGFLAQRGWEWANDQSGLGMFERLHQAVMLLDGLLAGEDRPADPLTDRARFQRGRILYWLGRERGGPNEVEGGRRDLQELFDRYPQDRLLAMYVGQKIDTSDPCDEMDPERSAPAWSIAQREALCRLRATAHWWARQQADNGELGGKLGDDVELLRWWAPLVLTGDEVAQQAWLKLADGIWQSRHVDRGYARDVRDVEHASEFVADTAPLLTLFHDDSRYVDRLALSAEHFENLWTGRNDRGNRFFRSAWFSSTQLNQQPPHDRDLGYNSRAVKAMRYLVWRRPDPHVTQLLHEWARAWAQAALRTDKGKPRGLIPASVRFPDEAFNGEGNNWYRAGMFWEYFDWEHDCGSMVLDHLLFTYQLTKDESLLEPMFQTLELIENSQRPSTRDRDHPPEAGSPAWAAARLIACELFWSVVEQWRFQGADPTWDHLIRQYGSPYGKYRISGDQRHLVAGLDQLLDDVRYNWPLKTSEAIPTDRVTIERHEHLRAMLTGDGTQESLCPHFAVTWEGTGDQFTALVAGTGGEHLAVHLYHHDPANRTIVMRPWQLTPGTYRLVTRSEGQPPAERLVTVQERGTRIKVSLAGHQLHQIALRKLP
jgi:hypothetical protein